MRISGKILIILLLTISEMKCDLTVEYYSKLISENMKKAMKFTIPESNEEFRKGYETKKIIDFGHYDFIIVGAGSAGSVVATRLSEISSWKILLLEAGGEETDFSNIPGLSEYLQYSDMNWGYFSTPQRNCCLGMKNRQCELPRGKSIGGSSAINAVMYVRGNPIDYNKWGELGNPGWSYEEVLPYFIKSENSQVNGAFDSHGTGGFWNVENSFAHQEDFPNFIQANVELNLTYTDYNSRKQIGVSKCQVNVMHGRRQSLGTAFLAKARKRSNLRLLTKALATKIYIDKTTKTAQGVEFVQNEQKFRARAIKEVIVCAGAINSPQLLMLSGIGPKKHLEDVGIEVIKDLPVGKYLTDHPLIRLAFHTNFTADTADLKKHIEEYIRGTGTLTVPFGGSHSLGFITGGNLPDNVPMIQYIFKSPGGESSPIQERIGNFRDEILEDYIRKINPKQDFQIDVFLLHQKSRGKVTLKSNSPIDFPDVDFNFFSESEDVDNLIEGINFIMKLTLTETYKQVNTTLVDIPFCSAFERYSRSFWKCAIKQMANGGFHLTGTTRMGSDERHSVVDNNLKMHGVNRLRVVDAGIFPSTVSGNTNAPTVMVAEKVSDVIIQEFKENENGML